ncbi:uncharacterized protein LOC111689276 [Lucilia cuprina]|uniref:uncharacterized protein LOC111689276 n=1 Tax=Lucilia cuprina TaxID=7375 RepID=UPI001F069A82|nr:uncharacterized protein LOC111689276 [Lucilia cuprina]
MAAMVIVEHVVEFVIPKFLETSWTDRRPDFKVNMTFSNQGFIRSLNWFERDITSPVARLVILQKDCCDRTSTLYNLTTRLCDIQQFISKVPMFKETILKALKQGNYTYECPLRRGFYVMDNVRINSRNPILAFMYRPNRTFTFTGGLYEELANRSILPLSTYRFTGKIVKKVCKEF